MATDVKQSDLSPHELARLRRRNETAIAKPVTAVRPIDPVKMREMCLWVQKQEPDALLALLIGHAMWRD